MRFDHHRLLLDFAEDIRMAMDVERGMLDLRACLDVADALEVLGRATETAISGAASGRSAHLRVVGPDFLAGMEGEARPDGVSAHALEVDELRGIFKLRSFKEYKCLYFFMNSSGKFVDTKEVSSYLNSTDNSVKVYISNIRKSLKEIGIVGCIQNRRCEGYCMPSIVERRIRLYMNAFSVAM